MRKAKASTWKVLGKGIFFDKSKKSLQESTSRMIVFYFKGFWTVDDARHFSDFLFIFGDNEEGWGKKGQAIIRDEPNALGVPTKKRPFSNEDSYYTDKEFDKNIKIDEAFKKLAKRSKKYRGIILPENGIGTGLAKLEEKAPKTFKYLQEKLKEL